MGEALFELQQNLSSKQLTFEEARILQTCKSKAVNNFTVGALVGAGVGWIAPWRFSKFLRINISGGAAALFGFWSFDRSLASSVDHILAMDGTRMQRELANIIVTKSWNDSRTKRYLSKHFYLEKVFDDSSSDQPKLRWRYRNSFSDNDNLAYGETNDFHSNPHSSFNHESPHDDSLNTTHSNPDSRRSGSEAKQVLMMPGTDATDPFDCIFGSTAENEEIYHPNASSTTSNMHSIGRKRSHRRRRMHHQAVLTRSRASMTAG